MFAALVSCVWKIKGPVCKSQPTMLLYYSTTPFPYSLLHIFNHHINRRYRYRNDKRININLWSFFFLFFFNVLVSVVRENESHLTNQIWEGNILCWKDSKWNAVTRVKNVISGVLMDSSCSLFFIIIIYFFMEYTFHRKAHEGILMAS